MASSGLKAAIDYVLGLFLPEVKVLVLQPNERQ